MWWFPLGVFVCVLGIVVVASGALLTIWLAVDDASALTGGSSAAASARAEQLAESGPFLAAAMAVSASAFGGIAALMARAEGDLWTARLRLSGGAAGVHVAALLGVLAIGEVSDGLSRLADVRGGSSLELFERIMADASATVVVFLVILGALAGAAEELFFRGYMMFGLRQKLAPWAAIVLSALAFGFAHLDPVHSTFAFVIGVYLGWITWREGSLWPALSAHAINNGIAFAGIPIFGDVSVGVRVALAFAVLIASATWVGRRRPVEAARY